MCAFSILLQRLVCMCYIVCYVYFTNTEFIYEIGLLRCHAQVRFHEGVTINPDNRSHTARRWAGHHTPPYGS